MKKLIALLEKHPVTTGVVVAIIGIIVTALIS